MPVAPKGTDGTDAGDACTDAPPMGTDGMLVLAVPAQNLWYVVLAPISVLIPLPNRYQ